VVDPGVTGVLVPVRDPAALAGALRTLADPDRRRALGAAGLERAHREFDERRVVDTVLDTYRAVARRKGVALGGL
jgi:glycosyltransferase involved in cell wall biosynthesis